ncbi:MAG: ATP-binding protein, partial [Actinobacteria bacterium]|nr:ATP-binding protein [Actinomycetota bacterium]
MDLNTPELTRIFRAELEERSSRLVLGARDLAKKTLGNSSIPDLIRDAHTIRGSAGLLGHDAISEVGARLETLWQMVGEGYVPESGVIVAMEAAAGRLVVAFDSQDDETLAELAEKLDSTVEHSEMTTDVVAIRRPEEGNLGGLLESVSASLLGGATRVDTGDLYLLINRIVEVKLDAEALADLSLVSIEGADQDLFRRSWRGQLERLSSSVSDIQDQAVSLANVSFFEAVASVPQFVRYLARRMDKDVRFRLSGDDVLLDRQIVDLIREPLRHLLVNAVDHGIEAPQVRIAAGKTPTATVAIGATAIAEGVEVYVSDDGAGIDWDRVAEVGNESGLTVTPPDLSPLLFHPGFSTVKEITDFSGSGDGLSEALLAVERVNGALHIESTKGKGTVVTMTLPLSMVLQNVVVVALGDQFWGLPEAAVEASMSLAKAELSTTTSGRAVRFRSAAIPCVSLSLAVGAPEPSNESELLIVSTRSGMVAVTVSEIVDRRRVAVKNLGPILEGAGH